MEDLEKNDILLLSELRQLIEISRQRVAVFINIEITKLYWNIGKHISQYLLTDGKATYGASILPTLSAKLMNEYGKGFSARNLAKMIKKCKNEVSNKNSEGGGRIIIISPLWGFGVTRIYSFYNPVTPLGLSNPEGMPRL